MSRVARQRRRALSRLAQRHHRQGIRPRGSFIPHRQATIPERSASALHGLLNAARPAFAGLASEIEARAQAFARFGGPPPAPRFEQDWFPGLDAAALYAIVAGMRPRRIIEVGSGHSTRITARAIEDEGLATAFAAIDPAPRAALAGLRVDWRRQQLQATDPALVQELEAGDILFIDSSHVLVAGSDVAWLFIEWLPRLRPDVLVHIHDVFLPDTYPASWAWRGYNEQHAVAGLLLGGFEPVFASAFVRNHASDLLGPFARELRAPAGAFETSLWLRRVGPSGGRGE